jgi:hypothetical protein
MTTGVNSGSKRFSWLLVVSLGGATLSFASLPAPAVLAAIAERPGWEWSAAGLHRRIETLNGPVHLFLPRGFEASTAGTVFYVHGYFSDVDQAWKQHDLAAQFVSSGRNALFVVIEAPTADTEAVRWRDLRALTRAVCSLGGIDLPRGPSVAMVHSGGFRTLQGWLGSGDVQTVLMLDGLYGAEAELAEWLRVTGNHLGSLVLVGFDTSPQIERFIGAFPDTQVLDQVPSLAGARRVDKKGRVLFLHSQFGHMEIITERAVIPSVLQLTPLVELAGGGAG